MWRVRVVWRLVAVVEVSGSCGGLSVHVEG